jgi:hypothetical protein
MHNHRSRFSRICRDILRTYIEPFHSVKPQVSFIFAEPSPVTFCLRARLNAQKAGVIHCWTPLLGEIRQLPPKWGSLGVSILINDIALREEIPEDTPHVINLGEANSKPAPLQTPR